VHDLEQVTYAQCRIGSSALNKQRGINCSTPLMQNRIVENGMTSLELVTEALDVAKRIVVLTGAGVSAESGIPTFRDPLTGLWQRFDPSELASTQAFRRNPAMIWGWYEWRRMKVMQAQPNQAHLAIARLAERKPEMNLITQNVDDLHERAGSADVTHLHGSLQQPRCFACAREPGRKLAVPIEPEEGRALEPPRCHHCGGRLRPGVVWFGESLPQAALTRAFKAAQEAELLLVVGTSGVVYPVAELPAIARRAGARVLHINPQLHLEEGDWGIAGMVGEVLPQLIR